LLQIKSTCDIFTFPVTFNALDKSHLIKLLYEISLDKFNNEKFIE